MRCPKENADNLLFVFFASNLYHARNQKRYAVTQQVLEKNKIKYFSYPCREKTKLAQMCEVLVFGSYVSFYSAILNGIDPSPIPWVDYFKKEMR